MEVFLNKYVTTHININISTYIHIYIYKKSTYLGIPHPRTPHAALHTLAPLACGGGGGRLGFRPPVCLGGFVGLFECMYVSHVCVYIFVCDIYLYLCVIAVWV
jgi:hypothetical protein